ncbi:MAG: FAD-dependent monooxygenase [Rhizobiales bacterium]|nr:FAD-dependent monooxygenase [Hyphomicrobiales bacterium]
MSEGQFDLMVAGGGPAGLAAACLMASRGSKVALVLGNATPGGDPRTVALMQPAIRLLTHIGVWPGLLIEHSAPLKRLRLVDDMKGAVTAPEIIFDSSELGGDEPFGWNIPLAHLIPALHAKAVSLGVALYPVDAVDFVAGPELAVVRLCDDDKLSAPLVLAADGRDSRLRAAAGIAVDAWEYDQSAVATSFSHSASHRDTSTEYHRPGGPFTTVPLPGLRSGLVWMERPERARVLMTLDDARLASEIQLATHGELGRIGAIGPRRLFPMRGLKAREMAVPRLMLVGEAAHVVPPIGAQGLNMSFRDIAEVYDIIGKFGDLGSKEAIAAYKAARTADIVPRQTAIDLMNRSLLADLTLVNGARAAALAAIGNFGPLRRFAMRRGLQPPGALPGIMRTHI